MFCVFYFIKISKFALPGVMLIYERTSKDRKKERKNKSLMIISEFTVPYLDPCTCMNVLFMFYIRPVKQKKNQRKIAIIFLSISLNMCFGCLREPSHCESSFEYPQHMFWLRIKKIIFSYILLTLGLVLFGQPMRYWNLSLSLLVAAFVVC